MKIVETLHKDSLVSSAIIEVLEQEMADIDEMLAMLDGLRLFGRCEARFNRQSTGNEDHCRREDSHAAASFPETKRNSEAEALL